MASPAHRRRLAPSHVLAHVRPVLFLAATMSRCLDTGGSHLQPTCQRSRIRTHGLRLRRAGGGREMTVAYEEARDIAALGTAQQ